MNLLFGVFRSKLETSTQDIDSWALDNSPVQAFQIGNPFNQMADLEQNGFLFILVGLLFAIVSLLDGLFFRDIYAGYGSLGEKVLKAEKDLNNHNSVLKESLIVKISCKVLLYLFLRFAQFSKESKNY